MAPGSGCEHAARLDDRLVRPPRGEHATRHARVLHGDLKWRNWLNRSLLEGLNASTTVANPYAAIEPWMPQGSDECINGWRGLSPLALIFQPLALITLGLVVFVYALINLDGETTWLEGAQLIAFYTMIAVTAFAMKGDEEKIRSGGCEAYIAKPISVANFIETIQRVLG